MISENQIDDVQRATVYDRSGDKIGKAGQVYLDDATGTPSWITVNTGLFGTSESFVPLEGASFNGGDRVEVAYEKSQVKDAPRVAADGHLEVSEEEELYRYYGLGGTTTGTADYSDTTTGTTTGTAGYEGTTTGTTTGSADYVEGTDRGTAYVGGVGADRAQQHGRGRTALVQQGQQHVPRLDRGVPAPVGVGDRPGDDVAALGGQTFGVHVLP